MASQGRHHSVLGQYTHIPKRLVAPIVLLFLIVVIVSIRILALPDMPPLERIDTYEASLSFVVFFTCAMCCAGIVLPERTALHQLLRVQPVSYRQQLFQTILQVILLINLVLLPVIIIFLLIVGQQELLLKTVLNLNCGAVLTGGLALFGTQATHRSINGYLLGTTLVLFLLMLPQMTLTAMTLNPLNLPPGQDYEVLWVTSRLLYAALGVGFFLWGASAGQREYTDMARRTTNRSVSTFRQHNRIINQFDHMLATLRVFGSNRLPHSLAVLTFEIYSQLMTRTVFLIAGTTIFILLIPRQSTAHSSDLGPYYLIQQFGTIAKTFFPPLLTFLAYDQLARDRGQGIDQTFRTYMPTLSYVALKLAGFACSLFITIVISAFTFLIGALVLSNQWRADFWIAHLWGMFLLCMCGIFPMTLFFTAFGQFAGAFQRVQGISAARLGLAILVIVLSSQASGTILGNILMPAGQMTIETVTAGLRAGGYFYLTVVDPPGPIVEVNILVLPLIASVIVAGVFVSLARLVILWRER